jgi:hypothetical protein
MITSSQLLRRLLIMPTEIPALNTIPEEIVDFICQHPSRHSICALRLTDRRLAQATLKSFGDSFRSISATCSIQGLEHLEQRSRQTNIASKVEHVTFCVADEYIRSIRDQIMQNPRNVPERLRVKLSHDSRERHLLPGFEGWLGRTVIRRKSAFRPHPQLIFTIYNYLCDSIRASLRAFPKLESIMITEEPSSGPNVTRPFKNPGPLIEGTQAPYGFEAILDIVGRLISERNLTLHPSLHQSNLQPCRNEDAVFPGLPRPRYDMPTRSTEQIHRDIVRLLQHHLHSIALYPSFHLGNGAQDVPWTLVLLSTTPLKSLEPHNFDLGSLGRHTPADSTSICYSRIHL